MNDQVDLPFLLPIYYSPYNIFTIIKPGVLVEIDVGTIYSYYYAGIMIKCVYVPMLLKMYYSLNLWRYTKYYIHHYYSYT